MAGRGTFHANEAMPKRLDKKSKTTRVPFVAAESWLAEIDEWRSAERPIPGLSAAIRRLVEIGLAAERARKAGKP